MIKIEGLDLHDLCIACVNEMHDQGITKHVTYVNWIDDAEDLSFAPKADCNLIPKVTIEWVDKDEVQFIEN